MKQTYFILAFLLFCFLKTNHSQAQTVGSNSPVCEGETLQLFVDGGISWKWSGPGLVPPNANAQAPTILSASLADAAIYFVTVTDAGGGTSVGSTEVIVHPAPMVTASSNSPVCEGDDLLLTASGGVVYYWSGPTGFASNTQNPVISSALPFVSGVYPVTVTDVNGCSGVAEVNAIVTPAPAITITPNQSICMGASAILSASGGDNYLWNTGETTETIVVTPTEVENTYSVIVTDASGCSNTAETNVTAGTIMIDADPNPTICSGASVTIIPTGTAEGGNGNVFFSISSVPIDEDGFTVNPINTITYTIYGVSSLGCTATDQITIFVEQAVANAGPDQTICLGETATLTATGGVSYEWNTGQITQTIAVNPSVATTYTVTVTDSNGCQDTDEVTVTVDNAVADAGPDQTICIGETTVLAASGGVYTVWSNGVSVPIIVVSPTVTTTYTATVTELNGCQDIDEVTVFVEDSGGACFLSDQVICLDESATLTLPLVADATYLWNTGDTTHSILVAPITTTTYSATIEYSDGTTEFAEAVIFVSQFIANAGPDQTICIGEMATLMATGGASYSWSTGQNTQTITVSPVASTAYTVTTTDVHGCQDTDEVTITVAETLSLSNLSYYADPCGEFYTLSLEITGGDPATYAISGLAGSFLSTGTFTSAPIPCYTPYNLTIEEQSGCAPITLSDDPIVCECVTDAGVMSIEPIIVCQDKTVIGLTAYSTLDECDVLDYILHTVPTSVSDIIAQNQTGEFTFDESVMNLGTTYFISAVAGNDVGDGTVDVEDPCLSIANGTPVIWDAACEYPIGIEAPITPTEWTVALYPNPVIEKLFIESSEAINTLKVFNTLGQVVFKKNYPTGVTQNRIEGINVADWQNGFYLVHLQTKKGIINRKVLVW